jgi:2-phospho-L-lactate transferase/gluconeogenesis factor (CofD/UPF0052 family)
MKKSRVLAVSPLIGAVKGPADRVLSAFGYGSGTQAIIDSYGGLLTDIVIDSVDSEEAIAAGQTRIEVTDTRMTDLAASTRLARFLLDSVARDRPRE